MLLELFLYFRHIRIFGMASPELFMTFFTVYLIMRCKGVRKDFWMTFLKYSVVAFLVAIYVHYVFGVNTQLNYWLGLAKCPPNYDSLLGIFSC